MAAIDFSLKAIQENSAWEDFDDAEETLSFSDLPLNSNFSMEDRDDYSKEYETSSFDQDDNSFEFFSEDLTAFINTYPSTDIIFCGKKLIPTQKQEITKSRNSKFKSCIFPWKSISFKISKQEKCFKKCKSFPVNNIQDHHQSKNKYDFSTKRASILGNSSVKSRGYLFGRIPMEMELRDIRTRQSKRKPSTTFRYQNTSEIEIVKNDKAKRLKGLWGLLRLFVFA